jgi:Uncharacterized protein conserved in archaea
MLVNPYGRVYVLRLGHRPGRDRRVTTHVGLVARAFGANGFILEGCDESVLDSLRKVLHSWGGDMAVECCSSGKEGCDELEGVVAGRLYILRCTASP